MPEQAGGSGLPVARSAVARRRRREEVELALLAGERGYGPRLARAHGVSLRVIRSDARAILGRWAREDRRRLDQRRALLVRRTETVYGGAVAGGDLGTALRALLVLARLLGLDGPSEAPARLRITFSGRPNDLEPLPDPPSLAGEPPRSS